MILIEAWDIMHHISNHLIFLMKETHQLLTGMIFEIGVMKNCHVLMIVTAYSRVIWLTVHDQHLHSAIFSPNLYSVRTK